MRNRQSCQHGSVRDDGLKWHRQCVENHAQRKPRLRRGRHAAVALLDELAEFFRQSMNAVASAVGYDLWNEFPDDVLGRRRAGEFQPDELAGPRSDPKREKGTASPFAVHELRKLGYP